MINEISRNTTVTFKIDGEITKKLKGRISQTLWQLKKHADKGITADEVSSWALRLADYVFSLRHHHRICIRTIMEPHDGGQHARYILQTPVEIVEVSLSH